jgi:RNA recognition motif-containing protein
MAYFLAKSLFFVRSQSPESHQLKELFEPFGTVSKVKLTMNRKTAGARGFGFVTMGNISEGNAAIKGPIKDKGGRTLTVNEARPKMIEGTLLLDRVANCSESGCERFWTSRRSLRLENTLALYI